MKVFYAFAFLVHGLCLATVFQLKFNRHPSNAGFKGLIRALERHHVTRGVRFDTKTGSLSELSDSWYSNPTFESDNSYYYAMFIEPVFEPFNYGQVDAPPQLGNFSSIIMTCKHLKHDGQTSILIKNQAGGTLLFISLRNYDVVFNSLLNGKFGTEIYRGNPMRQINATHRLEVKLTPTHFQIFIDDASFYNFTHRTVVDLKVVHWRSSQNRDTLQKLQYIYPST